MIEYELADMSCGHCEKVVRKTVAGIDAVATVEVDLASKRVRIDSAIEPKRFADALDEAGYPPSPR